MASQFDIHSIVEKPTWKQMLLELIDRNKIDPWDIDIALIADSFMKKVREMEKLDLAVQANIILAAAILLKYKSEYLTYLTMEEPVIEAYPVEEPVGDIEEIPQLTLVSRIPPKRQITLDELMGEMEKVIKYEDADRERIPRGSISETIDFVISEENIEKKMDEVLERIRDSSDESGWSLFSRVLKNSDSTEIIYTLISILHLVQTKKINIKQDKMFGEIFIFLLDREKEKMKMEISLSSGSKPSV